MSEAHECAAPCCGGGGRGMPRGFIPPPPHHLRGGGALGHCCDDSAHCGSSSRRNGGGTRSHCDMSHDETVAVGGLVQGFAGLGVGGKSFVGRPPPPPSCGNGHCHCEDEASDLASVAAVPSSAVLPPGIAHGLKNELAIGGGGGAPEVERVALGLPDEHGVVYEVYKSEEQMVDIMRLISKDLSEPYSIYTYRYFIHNWPNLCFLAFHDGQHVGAIVCKLDFHKNAKRGYIAMLAVDEKYRRKKIGSKLVRVAVDAMIVQECEEVVLETEVTNKAALRLYENLGFVRDKRLLKYYLNGVDAFRLKLWLR